MGNLNNKYKVLLVENGRTARAVLQQCLEDQGYQVTAVSNGKESIEAVKKEDDFAVVIMDLYMPEMNGTEATQAIRAFSQVPVFALTASEETQDEQACLNAGMNEFVLKTPDHKNMLDAVARYCAQKK